MRLVFLSGPPSNRTCRMFITESKVEPIPIHLVFDDEVERWTSVQPEATRRWLATSGFRAQRHKVVLLPAADGRLGAVAVGLGARPAGKAISPWQLAGVADRVPDGCYRIVTALSNDAGLQAAFGWGYGQYRFERYRTASARDLQLLLPGHVDPAEARRRIEACSLARDLINSPANALTPEALAQAVVDLAHRHRAQCRQFVGEELLREGFPAIHAVGRSSASAPRLVDLQWGDPDHPRVTLVGKGVCFDSGGLDIKPAASMLLMKKDMGGAACAIALAHLVMDAQLPVRLRLLVPAVENAVSAGAYRPGDVIATRRGLSVEVGNTDAEGRLVLCDALALADVEEPDVLIDLATLTGAARVALGPELPALFSSDDALAQALMEHGDSEDDPMWRLPLWAGYEDELSSKIADLNNVSSSGFSGAIIGGLFLKRFVTQSRAWAHIDLYAWNSKDRPGRPVGAEPQCIRALYAYLRSRYAS